MSAQTEFLFEAPMAHEAPGRLELEWQEQPEMFATRVLPFFPEGHEVLTRAAAGGLPGVDVTALLRGVIRPDRGGTSYWSFPGAALHSIDPPEQPRHALRPTPGTSVPAALAAIRRRLRLLYRRAMSARTPATAFEWIGEALHLIQDSYSRAHIERAYGTGPGGSHPIRYIRSFHASVFPPSRTRGPREHNFPSDPRDSIRAGGALKSEAVMARNASREYLRMMLRHRARPGAPGNVAELRAFMRKHLSM